MSNITLNIVEPGGPTPIDPVVPNTGLFTHGIGGPEATIITVSIVAIMAIVAAVLYYKKKHSKTDKAEKATKLAETINAVKAKKKLSIPLAALALVVSLGTLTALLVNAGKSNTNAAEGGLTVTTTGEEKTIEVGDSPVFAIAEVEVTVAEETQAGYTLTAYADNTDLVSTTDDTKIIPMVAADEGELIALAEDTYGLSLTKPASQDDEVFTALSTDADNPTFITDKDYEGTGENDKTTIYYGFYITPDTPYGTYEGSDIAYEATANEVATVTFDGNGLYFNGDESQTTNTTNYIVETSSNSDKYSHTPNINNDGSADAGVKFSTQVNEVITVPGASRLDIEYTYGGGYTGSPYNYQGGFGSFWEGSHPEYTPDVNYATGKQSCGSSEVTDGKYYTTDGTSTTVECSVSGDTVTFGYWTQGGGPGSMAASYGYYAIVTGYDADGNIIYLPENKMISGDYLIPGSDSYYRFLGWSTTQEATAPEYVTEEDIKKELALTPGETTTLYAKWEPAFTISYNGNGADTTTNMDNVEQYTTNIETSSQVDLLASNFKKSGYGFAGWSTDQDAASKINNTGDDKPTIYGPNQMITVDPSASTKLNLYAVWVPAETGVTMQTFSPNSEPYASKPNGTVIALEDERDNEVYAVAKLADGNYWMIENLRLDNNPELSQQNTNNPSLPLTNNYEEQITSNKLSETSSNWCNSWSSTEEQIACYDHSNLNTNNTASTTTSPVFSQNFTNGYHNSNFEGNIASYGNYYNWYSATAGNGKQETDSGTTVAGDICPAGWILPIGNQTSVNGSFSHLDTSMGGTGSYQGTTEASNRWRSFPNNFVYSGYWYGSSAYSRGSGGYYWSSTANNTGCAYSLDFNSDDVNPGTNSSNKNYGNSVRCVAPVQ